MNAFLWLLRAAVAATFGWAAVTKIADPGGFFAAILTYRSLPEAGALLLALWLPWAELTAAGAVFWPRHRRAALGLLFAFALMFLGALSQAWLRGLDINCGCFGRPALVRGPAYLHYLARDLVLLGTIAWLLWRDRRVAPANSG